MAINPGKGGAAARPTGPRLPTPPSRGGAPGPIHGGATGDPNYGRAPKTTQQLLDEAKAQQKTNELRMKMLRAQEAHLRKPNPKNPKEVAKYRAEKAKYEASLTKLKAEQTMLGKRIPNLQNKVYVETGQYDKLLTGTNRDAYLAVKSLFDSYGLGSLADKIYGYVKNGESADTISILLQDTPEYKRRFSGNEARKAAGLPVLSAAEYLATEAGYRQIMQSAGMPAGFYDQPSDFTNWIGANVSPTELQNRVDLAVQATTLSDPMYRRALNQMGIDNGHLTAYFLDQSKALPYLQKAAATAQAGAEALRQNLQFDQGYAEQLATMGVSADQARQGYEQIASELGTMKSLGSMYGEEWSQRTSEGAIFGTDAEAQRRKGRLLSQERGAFQGNAGAARGLGGLTQQGGAV